VVSAPHLDLLLIALQSKKATCFAFFNNLQGRSVHIFTLLPSPLEHVL
jgi:hypothetical protein